MFGMAYGEKITAETSDIDPSDLVELNGIEPSAS